MAGRKLISIVIFSFLFVTSLTFLTLALRPEKNGENSNKGQTAGSQTKKTSTPSAKLKTASPKPTPASFKNSSPVPPVKTPLPVSSPVVFTPSPTSISNQTPTPQKNQVNVSINNQTSFTVVVDEGLNQCDVLKKALEQGKISSLKMQYNSTYGSYAVYQINGIGKENAVWWTYKVNGVPPTQGCSYIKANHSDNIEWTYIGQ